MNASVAHPNTHFARPARRHAAPILACALVVLFSAGCSMMGRGPAGGDGAAIDADGLAAEVTRIRASMTLEPNEPYWPCHLGEVYVAADSSEQAAAALRDALAIDAGYAPAVTLLSKLYYEMRAHGAAVAALEAALVRNPEAPDAVRVALALHLDALGDIDGARGALAACGDDPDTYAARTFLALRDGESESALDTARRAIRRNPGSAANHNNYGITLLRSGRPGEARREFMTALEIDQDLPGALYNLAIVETFYFFDEDAGRRWFTRYRQYASEDPDDLASALGTDMTRLVAPENN